MQRIPVQSSNIAAIAYDPATQVMEIEFASRNGNNSVYSYSSVPADLWSAFLNAPSQGSFLASRIKGVYPAVRIQ